MAASSQPHTITTEKAGGQLTDNDERNTGWLAGADLIDSSTGIESGVGQTNACKS